MSGSLNASTPWVRQRLSLAAAQRLRLQVPTGYTLYIGCRNKPPDFTYVLLRDPNAFEVAARSRPPEVRRTMIRSDDIEAMGSWFLRTTETW